MLSPSVVSQERQVHTFYFNLCAIILRIADKRWSLLRCIYVLLNPKKFSTWRLPEITDLLFKELLSCAVKPFNSSHSMHFCAHLQTLQWNCLKLYSPQLKTFLKLKPETPSVLVKAYLETKP